jgi:hypothetical protein
MACAQVEDAVSHNCFDRRVIALARSSHFSSSDRSSKGKIDREICGIHRQNRWTLDICFASYVVVAVPLHDICCVAHWLSSSGWTSANFGSDMLRAVKVD